jgi:hypothetical protein
MTQTATAAAQTDRFGVPLKGWSFATQTPEVDDLAVILTCDRCGDTFFSEDADDTLCTACSMPPAEVAALRMVPASTPAACLLCGAPIYRGDADAAGTRHPRCARFLTLLAARHAARKEEPIAA